MQQRHEMTFAGRAGVTLLVLGAYYLASNIPVPGLEPAKIPELTRSGGVIALARLSIFSLGVMPLINALILVEVAKLAMPSLRQWERASFRNADRLSVIVVVLALVLAAFQALGVTTALEMVSGLVAEPGTQFRVVSVATLVAGAAIAIGFAGLIDRIGLGSGLWLIFLAPALAALPSLFATIALANSQGAYASGALLLSVIYSGLAIAAVASIVLAARAARATVETCVWTPFVAGAFITVSLLALGLIATANIDQAVLLFPPGSVLWSLGLVAAVGLTVALYTHSFALAGEVSPVDPVPVAACLAAILVAAPLLETHFGVVLPLESTQLIVLGAVGTTLLIRWGFIEPGKDSPREEAPADEDQHGDEDQSSGPNR